RAGPLLERRPRRADPVRARARSDRRPCARRAHRGPTGAPITRLGALLTRFVYVGRLIDETWIPLSEGRHKVVCLETSGTCEMTPTARSGASSATSNGRPPR